MVIISQQWQTGSRGDWMIEYRKGDVLKIGTEDIIVHGCNCFQSFGAGIANQIAGMYPEAYMADLSYRTRGDKTKLGEFSYWTGPCRGSKGGDITIVNMYTQYTYSLDKIDVEYWAIEKGMRDLHTRFWDRTISMPKIGCGLAGGDWGRVSEILDDVFEDRQIMVYEL